MRLEAPQLQQKAGLGVPLICPGVAPPQPGQSAAGLPVGAPVGIDGGR